MANLQLILTLLSWVVGLSVLLFTEWESIPQWARYTIIGFIGTAFIVTLLLSSIPVSRLIKGWIASIYRRRQQRQILLELTELLQEARMLFEPHVTNSLRNYVDSLLNSTAQDQTIHQNVKRLAERLHVLSDWHWSLLTFTHSDSNCNAPFSDVVRHIVRLYRDTADVVRELVSLRFPENDTIKAYDDDRRMSQENYNRHVDRVEQVLQKIGKANPELRIGGFHRF